MTKEIKEQLIIPIYINEKIVIDMLAIIDDGFSQVSQVSYTEHDESETNARGEVGLSTNSTILSRLLKINFGLEGNKKKVGGNEETVTSEKIHTHTSLLSKFRKNLIEYNLIKQESNIDEINIGDYIEIQGTLQKNPLIDYLDSMINMMRMVEIFTEEPELGSKKKSNERKIKNNSEISQVSSFIQELQSSGTIDFILNNVNYKVVLSTQTQYLTNDNISELIGGNFKVLGKVISISDKDKGINLLRKTSLSILSEKMLGEFFSAFDEISKNENFNLPELITEIESPAMIIIPIAIFA